MALLAAILAGCATATPPAALPPGWEEVKARLVELEQQVRVNEVELRRLRRQLAELEHEAAAAEGHPELTPPVDGGPTDEAPAEAPAPLSALEEADLEPQPLAGGAAPTALSPDAQAAYDEAYTLFHQGRYLDAEARFQRFLQDFEATSLADNALYWIGAARWARHDVPGALAAFRETVARFPEGNKVPDASFKIGQCLEALGDLAGARHSYRETATRFPVSAAAALAEERLAALGEDSGGGGSPP